MKNTILNKLSSSCNNNNATYHIGHFYVDNNEVKLMIDQSRADRHYIKDLSVSIIGNCLLLNINGTLKSHTYLNYDDDVEDTVFQAISFIKDNI